MNVMHVNTFQFENLYAYYSWPNVVLPIIGGELIGHKFEKNISDNIMFCQLVLLLHIKIILCQIGYLIDRIFGIRLGAVIFATFICLGKLSIKTFHQNL